MEWRNGNRMATRPVPTIPTAPTIPTVHFPHSVISSLPSSCAVLCPCFVNPKKVQSFTFPGMLYMRTQERCHHRWIYGQFKYLTNNRHTTINLRRHPMNVDGVCNARKQSLNSYCWTWILSVVSRVLPAKWRNGGMAEWRNGVMLNNIEPRC